MKKLIIAGAFVLGGLETYSFTQAKTGIVGKVSPANATDMVWILGGTDSLKSAVTDGQFYFDVKPGTYKLIVDAKEPYKDVLLENLTVKSDETLDVGEITLKQ